MLVLNYLSRHLIVIDLIVSDQLGCSFEVNFSLEYCKLATVNLEL